LNGEIALFDYNAIKSNITTPITWENRISKIINGSFTLNNFAKNNYISTNNYDKVGYNNRLNLTVSNETIDLERDIIKIPFNSANLATNGTAEIITYKQTSTSDGETIPKKTFTCEYIDTEDTIVYDINGYAKIVPLNDEKIGGAISQAINGAGGYTAQFQVESYTSNSVTVYDTGVIDMLSLITSGDKLLYKNGILEDTLTVVSKTAVPKTIIFSGNHGLSGSNNFIGIGVSGVGRTNIAYIKSFNQVPSIGDKLSSLSYTVLGKLTSGWSGQTYATFNVPLTEIVTVIDISGSIVTFDKNIICYGITETLYLDLYNRFTIQSSYSVYQNIIHKPIVKEVEINLGAYESATLDFTKPIYIKEWGKYCMLLELTAPDEDVCTATLLLINQTL